MAAFATTPFHDKSGWLILACLALFVCLRPEVAVRSAEARPKGPAKGDLSSFESTRRGLGDRAHGPRLRRLAEHGRERRLGLEGGGQLE